MGSRACTNGLCGASSSNEWKKGWPLRSGEFANLCDKCGSAYEQLVFCDTFHSKDTGWRECSWCGKRLHCGCIASSSLLELLDSGGVRCIGCTKSLGLQPALNDEKPKGLSMSTTNNDGEMRLTSVDNQMDGGNVDNMNLKQADNNEELNGLKDLLPSHNNHTNSGQIKEEEVLPAPGEVGTMNSSNFNQASVGSSETAKVDIYKTNMGIKDTDESLAQTNLTIALTAPSGNPNPFPGAVIEERESGKTISSLQQVSRSRHLLPKPPKAILAAGLETNAGMVPQIRVARPPAEGRVKNQLLPRYWPRITDQELQQISGDSNSTIVPLFEKVLSASDAGRIGRLVLPKACAEAYFPPISQPEGLPLRIQDVKGKEWVFQFRFWPNNNSRMYVLEGVTPCIQSMQLQAGDTVTFSRMDPEGKLLMGFRKASNSIAMQATHLSAIPNGALSSEPFFSGVIENLSMTSGYSGLLQSLKGSTDPHLNALSKHLNSAGGDFSWHVMDKHGSDTKDGLLPQSMLVQERKRSRNIGSKSKRLLIDSQDALELKLTWEEAQDMLRPPVSEKPSIVTIEDHEFEEYEEPPVFGKRSIFVARLTGGQEQWTQCDSCSKWRRLPADILLPPKWTCSDNILDQCRCSCSAPDELSPRELESLLRLNKDFKKRRMVTSHRLVQEHESAGLDALANAAVLGDDATDPGAATVATTTKHPRHRPGCSCIVCIQPPSGKGKHKPTCTCNVCMTVKPTMSSPAILFVVLTLLVSLSTSSATGDDTPTTCQVLQQYDFPVSLLTSSATDTLTAYQVLEQYGFPVGILPIGAKGYELDQSTGKFKAYLDETCTFTIQNYELKYKSTITGVIAKGKLKNLKGISVKILFLWLNIGEVIRDDDELEFSVGIASADFPIESFVESPQCGCGFDCVNGGEKKRPKFDFISFISALL